MPEPPFKAPKWHKVCQLPACLLAGRCRPAPEKVEKWVRGITLALDTGILSSGCAQKLAGRLSWTQQHMFFKIGRAFLRPIYDQKFTRDGSLSAQLRIALLWWRKALQQDLSETHSWECGAMPPAHLFVDARGEPPRCAAVLFDGFSWQY